MSLATLFKIVLTSWGPLRFRVNFRIRFNKEAGWDCERDGLESIGHVQSVPFSNIPSPDP